jgi:iron complex transport system ATP-binding protein
VIVTHHIEEIPAGTTHVLMLKEALAFASGPIEEVLTEQNLKALFGVDVALAFDGKRYFATSR